LVENEKVLRKLVDHKFKELDRDNDGKFSVSELHPPAAAHIGLALGLPPHGSSPHSDLVYSEVHTLFSLTSCKLIFIGFFI